MEDAPKIWNVKIDFEKPHSSFYIPKSLEDKIPYKIHQYVFLFDADHAEFDESHIKFYFQTPKIIDVCLTLRKKILAMESILMFVPYNKNPNDWQIHVDHPKLEFSITAISLNELTRKFNKEITSTITSS